MDAGTTNGAEAELPPTRRLARLRMLSDTPLADARADFFGYRVYARALADLIDSEGTGTPLTVAVSAPWGAGKTSVARMVERHLQDWTRQRNGERRIVTCWFPAWMHGDAPHLGAAMAAAIATVANRARPLWRRVLTPLPSAMLSPHERWVRRVRIGLGALLIVAVACAIRPVRDAASPLLGDWSAPAEAGSTLALLLLAALLWRKLFTAAEQTARFIDDPASEASRGSMVQVREQLGRLIRQATGDGRLVVFVDDLERCAPERAVEVCEVASQLLSHEGVVTVFVADMQAVSRAAAEQHAGLDRDDTGRRYLEKVVQIELAVPPPPPDAMKRLLAGEAPEPEPHEADADAGVHGPTIGSGPWGSASAAQNAGIFVGVAVGWAYIALGGDTLIAVPAVPYFTTTTATVMVFGAAGGAVAMVGAAVEAELRRRLARRKRHAINRLIQTKRDEGVAQDALEDTVVAAVKSRDEQLARRLVETYLVDWAEELAPVEDVIRCYPPPLPRAAKRMLNHARLLTRIARDRRLFGGDPALEPAHLGKWIVLQECWPELAKAVLASPDVLERLEQAATPKPSRGDPLPGLLRTHEIKVTATEPLRRLLTSEPHLGPVIERLVHFEPAGDPAPEPEADLVGGAT